MHPWPDLRETLRGLRWAVAGGVATRAFMPERMTKDLDIVVHPDDMASMWQRLEAAGFRPGVPLGIPGRAVEAPDGAELDVIEGRFDWIDDALATPVEDPAGLPVLDLPFLVLMKLAASRTVDLGDIARMLGLASDAQLAAVRAAVARFTPQDVEDLGSLIFLGRQEQGLPPE